MAIEGYYYRLTNDQAAGLTGKETREPLDPEDLANLRRNNDRTEFVINTVQALAPSQYIQRFANQPEMIEYINTTSSWRSSDMVDTDNELAAITVTGPQADATGSNLQFFFAPKVIMKSFRRGIAAAQQISEAFTSANTENVFTYIKKWLCSQTLIEADLTAGVGGSGSSFNSITELYNAHNMIYLSNGTSLGGVTISTRIENFPKYTMLLGMQASDPSRDQQCILGTDDLNSAFTLTYASDTSFVLKAGIATLKVFVKAAGDIINLRSSRTTPQMQPIFIQYDQIAKTLTIPSFSGSTYVSTGSQIYNFGTLAAAQSFKQSSWANKFMTKKSLAGGNNMAGTIQVFDRILTASEMKELRSYILSQ
tara:strand:- start:2162 stop:3259 length:1098 start_codon:yes stop_codon:yes gene_type:complete